MTNEEVAENLEITPKHLANFLNEKVNVEPDLSAKLAKSTGFCADTWLELQHKFNAYKTS
jgi:plasmid maintenance system antidote protein VapI